MTRGFIVAVCEVSLSRNKAFETTFSMQAAQTPEVTSTLLSLHLTFRYVLTSNPQSNVVDFKNTIIEIIPDGNKYCPSTLQGGGPVQSHQEHLSPKRDVVSAT